MDWQNVFIDTSVILSLLRSLRDDKDDVCNFIGKLMNDLAVKNSSKHKKRTFYLSSITISELMERANDGEKAAKIVKALNSENVTFHPFDNSVAEFVVNKYHSLLTKPKQTPFARQISWPEHDLGIAREWITKDLMIIATAHYLDCDVILTIDKNTMHPIAEKVDYPCALCYPDNFEVSASGKNIFNYDKPKTAKKETAAKKAKRQ